MKKLTMLVIGVMFASLLFGQSRVSINGWIEPASAFGVADAKIKMVIQGGTPPYTINLKLNGNDYRTITTPTSNGDIFNLPTGAYYINVSDNATPPTSCNTNADWFAVSPPYATLNGSVNSQGLPTTVYFEYGLTTEYGNVAEVGVVNTLIATKVSLKLSSGLSSNTSMLEPGKTYHYRIKAVNSDGTAFGTDKTFTTPSTLPIVKTLSASEIK